MNATGTTTTPERAGIKRGGRHVRGEDRRVVWRKREAAGWVYLFFGTDSSSFSSLPPSLTFSFGRGKGEKKLDKVEGGMSSSRGRKRRAHTLTFAIASSSLPHPPFPPTPPPPMLKWRTEEAGKRAKQASKRRKQQRKKASTLLYSPQSVPSSVPPFLSASVLCRAVFGPRALSLFMEREAVTERGPKQKGKEKGGLRGGGGSGTGEKKKEEEVMERTIMHTP